MLNSFGDTRLLIFSILEDFLTAEVSKEVLRYLNPCLIESQEGQNIFLNQDATMKMDVVCIQTTQFKLQLEYNGKANFISIEAPFSYGSRTFLDQVRHTLASSIWPCPYNRLCP